MLSLKGEDPIAAACGLTRIRAGVARLVISIVTDLTGVDATVSALLEAAQVIATIADLNATVIAGFPGVHAPVAAGLNTAGLVAAITVYAVPIIAGFDPLTDLPITAACRSARAQTAIGLDPIAVIAELAVLQDPVSTAGWLARVARVSRVIITIIAAFAWPEDSIPAASHNAGV